MAAATDPITTHVLDQTSGTPAVNLSAALHLRRLDHLHHTHTGTDHSAAASSFAQRTLDRPPPFASFAATTAPGSGRITHWRGLDSSGRAPTSLADALHALEADGAARIEGELLLDAGRYWAGRGMTTFYQTACVRFVVDLEEGRDHWHVPVLLGPHGYTTYRGT